MITSRCSGKETALITQRHGWSSRLFSGMNVDRTREFESGGNGVYVTTSLLVDAKVFLSDEHPITGVYVITGSVFQDKMAQL